MAGSKGPGGNFFMSRNIRNSILFLSVLTFLFSCKKDPDNIGLNIQPEGDLLGAKYVDTITLVTHTVKDDSLRSDEILPMQLGIMNDPVFGFAKASFYTQFSLSATNPSFGPNPVLDSAVLSLVYFNRQYYGTLQPQKFAAYEVTQPISRDSAFYTNSSLLYSTELGSRFQIPVLGDSVMVGTEKFPCHLRMNLDTNFFKTFLTNTSFYNSNSSFWSYFQGMYLTSVSAPYTGEGAILAMDVTNKYSRLTLYYHNDTASALSYYFGISKDACGRFSRFDHDYSITTDINVQLSTSANVQEDKVFVQPMAGVRTKITLPSLMTMFNNQKVAINKAELILKAEPSSVTKYTYSAPAKLIATIADSALGALIMPDYFEGLAYFGGDYDATNKEYKFNIARYIQQVLDGKKKNNGIYIIANSRLTTANRIQLIGGNKALAGRMQLRITYTPLNR